MAVAVTAKRDAARTRGPSHPVYDRMADGWLAGWPVCRSVGLAGPYPRYMCQWPVRAAAYTHPPRFASVPRAPFTLIPACLTEACYSFSR